MKLPRMQSLHGTSKIVSNPQRLPKQSAIAPSQTDNLNIALGMLRSQVPARNGSNEAEYSRRLNAAYAGSLAIQTAIDIDDIVGDLAALGQTLYQQGHFPDLRIGDNLLPHTIRYLLTHHQKEVE